MNKYGIKGKAKQAAQLTAVCIIALAVFVLSLWAVNVYKHYKGFSSPPPRVPVPAALVGPEHTFEDLLDAIEWVESKGDPWAVGDNGNAVGAYQIHKIYVDDVKRIERRKKGWGILDAFEYADRTDKGLSRKMVTIYLKHYGGTFEEMARKHNGGPTGHKKESTKPYWTKVQARLVTKTE